MRVASNRDAKRLRADAGSEIRVNEELKEQILVTGIEIRRD
ncbi:hypothetical protein [Vibrio lentus]|nr:hypothetical protein [Vibrio lentus]